MFSHDLSEACGEPKHCAEHMLQGLRAHVQCTVAVIATLTTFLTSAETLHEGALLTLALLKGQPIEQGFHVSSADGQSPKQAWSHAEKATYRFNLAKDMLGHDALW